MIFKKKLEGLRKIVDRINEKIDEVDRKIDELKDIITGRYRKDDKYKIELYTNYLTSYLQDLESAEKCIN